LLGCLHGLHHGRLLAYLDIRTRDEEASLNGIISTITKVKGQTKHLLNANSPAILTAIGISGIITTAYLTGKASYEAAGIIKKKEIGERVPDDFRERLQSRVPHVWRLYIPAATSGVITIGCVVMSTRISARRTAALAAAYSLSEKAFIEYKDKVAETVGQRKEKTIRDDVAQDRVNEKPPIQKLLVMSGPGNVLCFDQYTGRYFHSDMESIRRAQNNINDTILKEGYASLTDFYSFFNAYCAEWSSNMGWDKEELLELSFSAVLFEGAPVLAIEYNYIKSLV
jgi:hypothetical protein